MSLLAEGGEALGSEIIGEIFSDVGDKASEKTGNEVGKVGSELLIEGPGGIIKDTPLNLARETGNDMVTDATIDGLHHLPIFSDIIDSARGLKTDLREGIEEAKTIKREAGGKDVKLKNVLDEHFGVEDVKKIDSGMEQLKTKGGYKPKPKEQQVIDKLVNRQQKVFDILTKYRKLSKSQDVKPEFKKQMNDEITEVMTKKDDGKDYSDELLEHKKNFINHIYNFPKSGEEVSKIQRENVFSAIEKDIVEHDMGTGKTPPRYRSQEGELKAYGIKAKERSLGSLDFKKEITTGDIFIDDDGVLKIRGKTSDKVAGTKTSIVNLKEQISDVVSNSKRIPEETKELLLRDFKSDFKGGSKFKKGVIDFDNETTNKDFFRDKQAKENFEEVRKQMGNLGDLTNDQLLNPSNDFGKKVITPAYIDSLLPDIKPDIPKSINIFRSETPKLSQEQLNSVESFGGKIGVDNEISNWDLLTETQKEGLNSLFKNDGVNIKSPTKNRVLKYMDFLENKKLSQKPITAQEQGFLNRIDTSGIEPNFDDVTIVQKGVFERFNPDRIPKKADLSGRPLKTTKPDKEVASIFSDTTPETTLKTKASTIQETVEKPRKTAEDLEKEAKINRQTKERLEKERQEQIIKQQQELDKATKKAEEIKNKKISKLKRKEIDARIKANEESDLGVGDIELKPLKKSPTPQQIKKFTPNEQKFLDNEIFNNLNLRNMNFSGIALDDIEMKTLKDIVINDKPNTLKSKISDNDIIKLRQDVKNAKSARARFREANKDFITQTIKKDVVEPKDNLEDPISTPADTSGIDLDSEESSSENILIKLNDEIDDSLSEELPENKKTMKDAFLEKIEELSKLPDNIGKNKLQIFRENKVAILGTLATGTIGGAILGTGIENAEDIKNVVETVKKSGEDIITDQKKNTDTLKKNIDADGDEIKKKLENLDNKDGNTAIAQIINKIPETKSGSSDNENKQIDNSLKDIEKQIDRLTLLEAAKQTTIQQINDPTTKISTNDVNRRRLDTINSGLSQGREVLNTLGNKLGTDLKIVEGRKNIRKSKKEAVQKAESTKNKKLQSALDRGVLKQSQPVINIINQSKMGQLRDFNHF